MLKNNKRKHSVEKADKNANNKKRKIANAPHSELPNNKVLSRREVILQMLTKNDESIVFHLHTNEDLCIYLGDYAEDARRLHLMPLVKKEFKTHKVKTTEGFLYVKRDLLASFCKQNGVIFETQSSPFQETFKNKVFEADIEYFKRMAIYHDEENNVLFCEVSRGHQCAYVNTVLKKIRNSLGKSENDLFIKIENNFTLITFSTDFVSYFSTFHFNKFKQKSCPIIEEKEPTKKSKSKKKTISTLTLNSQLFLLQQNILYSIPPEICQLNTQRPRKTLTNKSIAYLLSFGNYLSVMATIPHAVTAFENLNMHVFPNKAIMIWSYQYHDVNDTFKLLNQYLVMNKLSPIETLHPLSEEKKEVYLDLHTPLTEMENEKIAREQISKASFYQHSFKDTKVLAVIVNNKKIGSIKKIAKVNFATSKDISSSVFFIKKEDVDEFCINLSLSNIDLENLEKFPENRFYKKSINTDTVKKNNTQKMITFFKEELYRIHNQILFLFPNKNMLFQFRKIFIEFFPDSAACSRCLEDQNGQLLLFCFALSDKVQNFLKINNIQLNLTPIYEVTKDKDIVSKLINYSKYFNKKSKDTSELLGMLRLQTLTELCTWNVTDNVCEIIIPMDIQECNPYFHEDCYDFLIALETAHKTNNHSFLFFLTKNKNSLHVENCANLIKYLTTLSYQQPVLFHTMNEEFEIKDSPHENLKNFINTKQSPFPTMDLIYYQNIVEAIRKRLQSEIFNLHPKETRFFINDPNDVIALSATMSVLKNKEIQFEFNHEWERKFSVRFVDKLLEFGPEIGVFSEEEVTFTPGDYLCDYFSNFQTQVPDNMTFTYCVEEGFFSPDNKLNLAHLLNSPLSELEAHGQVILINSPEGKKLIFIANQSYGGPIVLKKNEQMLNFYLDTFRPTLDKSRILPRSLTQFDNEKTLEDEFPTDDLTKDFICYDQLNFENKTILAAALSWQNPPFFHTISQLYIPKIILDILNHKLDENSIFSVEGSYQYEHQVEYSILRREQNSWLPRKEQPGITPLMIAFFCVNKAALHYLANRAKPNRGDLHLNTGLMYLLNNTENDTNSIDVLSSFPQIDITVQNKDGINAIHTTVEKKMGKTLGHLLKYNRYCFDWLSLQDNRKRSPIKLSEEVNDPEVTEAIKPYIKQANF